jgi:hypothetical protein
MDGGQSAVVSRYSSYHGSLPSICMNVKIYKGWGLSGMFGVFRRIGMKDGKLTIWGIVIINVSIILLIIGVYRLLY